MKQISENQLIEDFQKVHGDKYDYSKVIYKGNDKKVKIICKVHGVFKQTPGSHKTGIGCARCGRIVTSKKLIKPLEMVIKDFQKAHGNRYDYSKVVYKGTNKKVKIICNVHGVFEQTPKSHKKGRGCARCGRIASSEKQIKPLEMVIRDFQKVHGNKYDYSKVNYVKNSKNITIICPIHNEFQQTPANHLKAGCYQCGIELRKVKQKLSQEEIISKFKKTHGNKYDYSKVKYENYNSKIIIFCKKCKKDFKQTPASHLRPYGCNICSTNQLLSTEEFIKRAKKFHRNNYDYTKSKYIGEKSKITIICKKHGEQSQIAGDHMRGKVPMCCSNNKPISLKEWISRAKKMHNNFFVYDRVSETYKNTDSSVEIYCTIHKYYFTQNAGRHISKSRKTGCPKCAGKNRTTKDSINDFKNKHGDRYDYSKFQYKGSSVPGIVICNEADTLSQKVKNMIITLINNENKYNPIYDDEIKDKINQKFKLEYGRTHYTLQRNKIGIPRASERKVNKQTDLFRVKKIKKYKLIEKKVHGEFEIDYSHHIRGHGCPKCKSHGYNLGQKGYLYINSIFINKKYYLKIGISNLREERIKEFRRKTKNGTINQICYFSGDGTEVYNAEKYIMKKFKNYKSVLSKEDFPDGYSETLVDDEKTYGKIRTLINQKFPKLNFSRANNYNIYPTNI